MKKKFFELPEIIYLINEKIDIICSSSFDEDGINELSGDGVISIYP